MTKEKLLLIDGNSVAYRAFFALHNSIERFKNRAGLHTNAIYGFHKMLTIILEKEKPDYVLVAFDAGKTTFRHDFYKEYKGGRDKTPGEFKEQMPYIRELLTALGIKTYELPNYEADDIIGTMSRSVDPDKFDVVIVSGDRDLTQLATNNITVDLTVKGVSELESYTPEHIKEKYGLDPLQIIDMKGLAGDASDNIPGVRKVGEKIAIKLLKAYNSVEGVYEHLAEMKPSKMKENLEADREQALMSKKLATINLKTPVTVTLDQLKYEGPDLEKLVPFYKEMDFNSFLDKLDPEAVGDLIEPMPEIHYEIVKQVTEDMLSEDMTVLVEMLDENYHVAPIEAIAFGTKDRIYVSKGDSLLKDSIFVNWLANTTKKKRTYDNKAVQVALQRYNLAINAIEFDVLLAAYLLNTNDSNSDLADVAEHYGYKEVASDESVYGKGAKKAVPTDDTCFFEHLARKVKGIYVLTETLTNALKEKNQWDLFANLEMPVAKVLAEMEIKGIKVDTERLESMKEEFAIRLNEIEQNIYAVAGEEFNINSPKQLGVILFEKLELPVIKKTKTGYSTAVDVLEQLKGKSPIIEDILTYRQIMKIQSTYVEGLLKVVHPSDHKVHTRYVQTLTQTGRLSSVDPNLQNIPIRLEEGRKIRQAFIPEEPDWFIYSSDYSQIELRVLAHISKDEHLRQAFIDGLDIHASTAMRVFGIDSKEAVTPNMRRQAKAVNFGIVYGISDYGLSQNLGISRKQAQQFIDTYFEKYPGVKNYMEEITQEAKEKGYVETLYHRRRYLEDINSRNYNRRSFAERTAINTPIQGSAADIIKIAMVQMEQMLEKHQMKANMLLQVHDELVFEVPADELEQLDKLVTETMENAVHLSIPLKADSNYGHTWYEAK